MRIKSGSIKRYTVLSKQEILKRVSAEELFSYYCNHVFKVGDLIISPLRRDRKPTFSFYKSIQGEPKFKDFATGTNGDVFTLVQIMYGVNFFDSLKIVNKDFSLGLGSNDAVTAKKSEIIYTKPEKVKRLIQVKPRSWSIEDKKFWSRYSITKNTLKKFNVHPISEVYLDKKFIKAHTRSNPMYAFYFLTNSFKIYSPYCKKMKWLSNVTLDDIQGFDQVVFDDKPIVITSSLKDVMTLYEFDITAVAPQGESNSFGTKMLDLIKRFPETIILYDNDEPGKINANKRVQELQEAGINARAVFIPEDSDCKDPSDFISKYGEQDFQYILNKIIWQT